jgi:hypothetical protein
MYATLEVIFKSKRKLGRIQGNGVPCSCNKRPKIIFVAYLATVNGLDYWFTLQLIILPL